MDGLTKDRDHTAIDDADGLVYKGVLAHVRGFLFHLNMNFSLYLDSHSKTN
jgi:hypothetical protein